MNYEPLKSNEREVLGRPGVSEETRLQAREGRRGRYQCGRSADNDVGKREFLTYTQKA